MIRDRFTQTRAAVIELAQVQALIDSDGDDWHPGGVRSNSISDPTANRALRNVDYWQERLESLRKREAELFDYIGFTLRIIEAVRECFGSEYADLLEARYIDCLTWRDIGISKPTGKRKVSIVFDWIDSVGVSRLLKGDFEL